MRRFHALAATGTALIVVLTGCAGVPRAGAGPARPTATSAKTPDPVTVLIALEKRIDTVKSFEATFTYRRKEGRYTDRMKGQVAYASQPKRAFDYDVEELVGAGVDQPGGVRVRQFGLITYVKMPLLAPVTFSRPWVRIDLSKPPFKHQFGLEYVLLDVAGVDPIAHTRMLTSSTDVVRVGPEQVDGAPTVHYKGTYQVKAGQERLTELEYKPVSASIGGVSYLNFDLWLNERGLPRKVVLSELDLAGNRVDDLALTLRFSAIDEPVDISRPPPKKTMSAKTLDAIGRARRS